MKFRIIQLSLVTVTAVALITYLSGFHMKSFYNHETRSQVIKAINLGSTFKRFDSKPSSGSSAISLSGVAPTGRLKPIPSSTQPTILPDSKSWKATPRHRTTLITKTVCVRHYPLLILVSSAPANFERRYLIRQTWGADNNIAPQWKTYFLLGQTRDQTHSDLLKKENSIYGDMIRADYYEHYWNQTFKIQMAFEWAARYCKFSYLLKADDDVFVNSKRLLDVFKLKTTPTKGLYMGKLQHNPFVQRKGKWRVSYEEYSGTHYPDFCSGGGFVMSYDVVESVVPLFDVIKPYRMDDVYVGMLAEKLGVRAVNHAGFVVIRGSRVDHHKCNIVSNILLQHPASGECLIRLFMNHKNILLSS